MTTPHPRIPPGEVPALDEMRARYTRSGEAHTKEPKSIQVEYVGELTVDGLSVAKVWSRDRAQVAQEIAHYAMMYAGDGRQFLTISEVRKRK